MGKLSKRFSFSLGIVVFLSFILAVPFFVQAADIDGLRQDLEDQIKQKQAEINQYQQQIQENQNKSKTLKNEIQILEDQISQVQLEIKQIDLVIQKSTLNIQEIDSQINVLEGQINQKKDLLAEYIRMVAYADQETLLEIILKNEKFSDFFDQLNALETAQGEIHNVLASIHEVKEELNSRKLEIEEEREAQNRIKAVQLYQKRSIENIQWQKEDILDKTRGEERLYQQMIQGTQEEIVFIKEQLSLLEKYNITLDDAIQNALYAGAKTGIRPAFLLGVLENESRLGLNVGTGNWRDDMHQCYLSRGYITVANKQKDAFLQICQSLGLNPDLQPVSARPAAYVGCGGAMGIAQFMPTTWMGYKDRIAGLTGNNLANPWNLQDAFLAAAIKLADAGANQKTYTAERKAYAMYIGGKYWSGLLSVAERAMVYAEGFQKEYFD